MSPPNAPVGMNRSSFARPVFAVIVVRSSRYSPSRKRTRRPKPALPARREWQSSSCQFNRRVFQIECRIHPERHTLSCLWFAGERFPLQNTVITYLSVHSEIPSAQHKNHAFKPVSSVNEPGVVVVATIHGLHPIVKYGDVGNRLKPSPAVAAWLRSWNDSPDLSDPTIMTSGCCSHLTGESLLLSIRLRGEARAIFLISSSLFSVVIELAGKSSTHRPCCPDVLVR